MCVCVCVCVCVCARARACTQLCSAVCDLMNCSPSVSSVHGVFQERILEWVALTKKHIHNLKELLYSVGLSPALETASQKLWENCSKDKGGEIRLYIFATKGAGRLNIKVRYQIKEFSIHCMESCKPLDSLNSFLSYAPWLSWAKSCFLVLPKVG